MRLLAAPGLLAAALAAALLMFLGLYFILRRRLTAEEKERRRRLAVNASGRIADALVTGVERVTTPGGQPCHLLHYSYDLNGVAYQAAQDITALLESLGRDPHSIAGPASVKYLPGNPSNSIVVCEQWSGLRLWPARSLRPAG